MFLERLLSLSVDYIKWCWGVKVECCVFGCNDFRVLYLEFVVGVYEIFVEIILLCLFMV